MVRLWMFQTFEDLFDDTPVEYTVEDYIKHRNFYRMEQYKDPFFKMEDIIDHVVYNMVSEDLQEFYYCTDKGKTDFRKGDIIKYLEVYKYVVDIYVADFL